MRDKDSVEFAIIINSKRGIAKAEQPVNYQKRLDD